MLLADYFVSLKRPFDSKIAAERKSITAARQARKTRDDTVAWLLIASAAAFLTCANRLPRRPAPSTQHPAPVVVARKPAPSPQPPAPASSSSTFVEELVAKLGRSKEATIPLLQAIQAHYRYLPDDVLRRVCELTEITPAEIAGTSSFYARFRRSPTGEHLIRVCHGTACHVSGARQITDELRRYLAIPEGADTDAARRFTIDEVACLGCCSLAPVLMVDGHPAGKLTPATACEALRDVS
ncbi:MAG: NAD(P)H-dependent oxidoreductase subunit E [Bryobacteraceae bacterium]